MDTPSPVPRLSVQVICDGADGCDIFPTVVLIEVESLRVHLSQATGHPRLCPTGSPFRVLGSDATIQGYGLMPHGATRGRHCVTLLEAISLRRAISKSIWHKL